jgi:hypothetical protein
MRSPDVFGPAVALSAGRQTVEPQFAADRQAFLRAAQTLSALPLEEITCPDQSGSAP